MIAAIGLGEILWSLLVLYVVLHVLIATVVVIIDLVASNDLSGAMKAMWLLALLLLPMLTVLAYLVTRGDGIGERRLARTDVPPPPPAPPVPSGAGPASELREAKSLLDEGAITAAEFERLKGQILA